MGSGITSGQRWCEDLAIPFPKDFPQNSLSGTFYPLVKRVLASSLKAQLDQFPNGSTAADRVDWLSYLSSEPGQPLVCLAISILEETGPAEVGQGVGQSSESLTHLLNPVQEWLQPVSVHLTVAVQESQRGTFGHIRASDPGPDQT